MRMWRTRFMGSLWEMFDFMNRSARPFSENIETGIVA